MTPAASPFHALRVLCLFISYLPTKRQQSNPPLLHALLYARIMVSSILNLVAALTACGMFAGSVIVSPCLTL